MIKSFRSKALKRFSQDDDASKLPVQNPDLIRRIIQALDAASAPEQMDIPGWRFHGLQGKPKRYAVAASGNYRITFGFDGEHAVDIDIEDYH